MTRSRSGNVAARLGSTDPLPALHRRDENHPSGPWPAEPGGAYGPSVTRPLARPLAMAITLVLLSGLFAALAPRTSSLRATTTGARSPMAAPMESQTLTETPASTADEVPPSSPGQAATSTPVAVAHPGPAASNAAVNASGGSLCPCDPRTGEPLGGAAQDKGFDVRVTDPLGNPLPGLCVQTVHPSWFDSDVPVLITDREGRASIDLGTAPKDPLLQLSITDCSAPVPHWEPKTEPMTPGSFSHITSVLVPAATITGTVVDQTRRPPAGGCVWVSPGPGGEWRSSRIALDGHYQVGGLTQGDHQILINLDCWPPQASRSGAHPAPLEPISSASGTTEVTLGRGQDARVDIAVYRPQNV